MQNVVLEPIGQGLPQIVELAIAFVLSALIGLEREYRQKSAGLRTYTIVGVAAALIMLVSKYGFTDVLGTRVILDPSRVAAQIVSGIGFIGGGVIFMRRDLVRGLTTAAIVWLTAAVGMACGAGLPLLALLVTAAHFIIVFGFPIVVRRLPRAGFYATHMRLIYEEGRGVLRKCLAICTQQGFAVSELGVERPGDTGENVASVTFTLEGTRDARSLASTLSSIDGALSLHVVDAAEAAEQA
jgi:putative Mg2+ transporter-C (MgtC) family protein